MKLVCSLFALVLLAAVNVSAQEDSAECPLITKKSKGPDRVILKPKANHFNRAVIVLSKIFNNYSTQVRVLKEDFNPAKGSVGTLKSTGQCEGNPECLNRKTYLLPFTGQIYNNKHGFVFIKVIGKKKGKPNLCRLYSWPSPKTYTTRKGG